MEFYMAQIQIVEYKYKYRISNEKNAVKVALSSVLPCLVQRFSCRLFPTGFSIHKNKNKITLLFNIPITSNVRLGI